MIPSFSLTFDQTVLRYGISAKALSGISGVSEASISKFRKGKLDLGVSSLSRLLDAMEQLEPDAKDYFFQAFLGGATVTGLNHLIELAEDEEIDQIMLAIASRLKNQSTSRKIRSYTGASAC